MYFEAYCGILHFCTLQLNSQGVGTSIDPLNSPQSQQVSTILPRYRHVFMSQRVQHPNFSSIFAHLRFCPFVDYCACGDECLANGASSTAFCSLSYQDGRFVTICLYVHITSGRTLQFAPGRCSTSFYTSSDGHRLRTCL